MVFASYAAYCSKIIPCLNHNSRTWLFFDYSLFVKNICFRKKILDFNTIFINGYGLFFLMVKDALRVTRRLSRKRGRNRAPRPKTFKTVEAAQHWAKEHDLKDIKVESKGKKFIVA